MTAATTRAWKIFSQVFQILAHHNFNSDTVVQTAVFTFFSVSLNCTLFVCPLISQLSSSAFDSRSLFTLSWQLAVGLVP